MKFPLLLMGAALLTVGCSQNKTENALTASGLDPEKFVAEYNGAKTGLYTLTNANGVEACITNFGARIVTLMVPDKDGKMHDVVLGFDSIQAYFPENNATDFGATIGRYANRIKDGKFVLNGDTITLPQNNYGHCLHGGPTGWQYSVFSAEQPNDSSIVLTVVSPDGDNNFPGNVTASVTYTLGNDNALRIAYNATTDAPTVINMTNHSYFNLTGNHANTVLDETLYINADNYTPSDSTFMPVGEIVTVEGTPMDFRTPKVIGQDIDADFCQTKFGRGFDHNWVLNSKGDLNVCAASVTDPNTGIKLEVFTDEPSVQIYTGNFLDGTVTGKYGVTYPQRAAICLETQHYPNSPNYPQWPTTQLNPGETYTGTCIYRFSTVD